MTKQRTLSDSASDEARADAEAFRTAMRDVTPLVHTPSAAGGAKRKTRIRARNADTPGPDNLDASMPLIGEPAPHTAGAGEDALTGGATLAFQRAGVRHQTVRRLRRGLYPIENELDLHGLTQTAARQQLADFIEESRAQGCRCVRIVHGKGYRSGARGPVLKIAVNLWLRRHLDVMAFVSARAIDGGSGAVYVLLRA
jgi:DNA-nicking Smr family endonuclease